MDDEAAISLVLSRLPSEEGVRPRAYNDATGQTVTCKPGGNLSIGRGINLENGLDQDEMDFLDRHRVTKTSKALLVYPWYQGCNPVRRSVLLDIAYNEGVGGLLHFPDMLAAVGRGDWVQAKAECHVLNPALAARYAMLGELLYRGEA